MTHQHVLIVTTSHDRIGEGADGDRAHRTGVWLEELAVPYYALRDGGAHVTIASIRGGPVPFDPRSIPPDAGGEAEEVPEAVRRFLGDTEAMVAARDTPAIDQVAGEPFDALFLPGGHGTMWDLPGNDTLALLVGSYLDDERVVAAVCHGPAGLLGARRGDGRPSVEGLRVSTFTNAEERAVGLADAVPFLLEDRLRELGARVETGPDFQPFALRDGTLITGQNPQSSDLVARHVLTAIGLGIDPAILDEQALRERAYEIWEQEGRPHGRDQEHWERARGELSAAADAFRAADRGRPATSRQDVPAVELEGRAGDDREATLGGAGTSGDLVTPRP